MEKIMKKKIVSCILIFILLGSICIPTLAATASELENEKNNIKDKIDETEQKKLEVEEQLSEQMSEISKLDASISETQIEINQLEDEIESLEKSIEEQQKKLEKKQEEHEKNKLLMEDRLVVMYETGEMSFLDMLFSSENIIEFISNYYMLAQITQCDKELLETIEKEQQEIEETKQKLEEEKQRVDTAKTEKETKNNLLKAKKSERQAKANALSAEEKKLQNQLDEYNKQKELQTKEILYAEYHQCSRKIPHHDSGSRTFYLESSGDRLPRNRYVGLHGRTVPRARL